MKLFFLRLNVACIMSKYCSRLYLFKDVPQATVIKYNLPHGIMNIKPKFLNTLISINDSCTHGENIEKIGQTLLNYFCSVLVFQYFKSQCNELQCYRFSAMCSIMCRSKQKWKMEPWIINLQHSVKNVPKLGNLCQIVLLHRAW